MKTPAAPLLALGAMVSIQVGSAIAKYLFDLLGVGATASLRLLLAGAIALLLWRPVLRLHRAALPGVLGLGTAIAGMNATFYAAIDRIPLGMAVTIEFLGPLTVAAIGSRRLRDTLWVLLAGGGVLLLMESHGPVSWTGVLFAIGSGACWGSYIACGALVGKHTEGHDGLAWAMACGGLLALPVGLAEATPLVLDPLVLLALLTVAVLSSLLPHALELTILRRLTAATFGVMMSLMPAVAALAGLLLLDEMLRPAQWAGIAVVVLAAAGAAREEMSPAPAIPTGGPAVVAEYGVRPLASATLTGPSVVLAEHGARRPEAASPTDPQAEHGARRPAVASPADPQAECGGRPSAPAVMCADHRDRRTARSASAPEPLAREVPVPALN
ncbi:EamA family transporter [Nocardia sp. NPDC127579]|uniref:EamA family transporter n=1 Tax=Nocardia sp. NPDC127579 TaxID=3345402 RepID=UPI0036440725